MENDEISDSQASNESDSLPTAQAGLAAAQQYQPARTARGRNPVLCGCSDDSDDEKAADAAVLICYGIAGGTSHKKPRRYHAACVGEDRWPEDQPWFCERCQSVALQTQSQETSASDLPSSQRSIERGVVGIIDSETRADGVYYKVKWARGSETQEDEFVHKDSVPDGPLLRKFLHTGQPAYASDDEDSDEEDLHQLDVMAGNPYRSYLERGFWLVLRKVYEDAKDHQIMAGIPFSHFHSEGMEVLMAMSPNILQAVCGAGLTRRALVDRQLRKALKVVWKKAEERRPCIYMLELTDAQGRPPTVSEMRRFIKIARQYASHQPSEADIAVALRIDAVSASLGRLDTAERADVRAGFRKYLTDGNQGNRRPLVTLLQLIERNLSSQDDERMPFVLRDIGYTDYAQRRIEKQHLKHQSSNKLMNLFEAISCADIILNDVYRMHGEVIALCSRESHARYAEVMFSIIAQSYVDTGRGFNATEAGLSNTSAGNVAAKTYRMWAHDTVSNSLFWSNVAAEKQRVANERAEVDRLRNETQTLKRRQLGDRVLLLRETLALQKQVAQLENKLIE